MANVAIAEPSQGPVLLDSMVTLNDRAHAVIQRLRATVFAPGEQKVLDLKFTPGRAAEMVGRTTEAIRQAEADGRLPAPRLGPTGRREGYSLAEVNAAIADLVHDLRGASAPPVRRHAPAAVGGDRPPGAQAAAGGRLRIRGAEELPRRHRLSRRRRAPLLQRAPCRCAIPDTDAPGSKFSATGPASRCRGRSCTDAPPTCRADPLGLPPYPMTRVQLNPLMDTIVSVRAKTASRSGLPCEGGHDRTRTNEIDFSMAISGL